MRHDKHPEGPQPRRLPILYKILMGVGALTLAYLFITYVVIPILAYFTVK